MSSKTKQSKQSNAAVVQKSRKNDSPKWKNPQDLFRKHLLRKTSSRRLITETACSSTSSPNVLLQSEVYTQSQPANGLYGCTSAIALRTNNNNPFKRTSPRKRTPVKRYGSAYFGSRGNGPKMRRRSALMLDCVEREEERAGFDPSRESIFKEIADNEQKEEQTGRNEKHSKTISSSVWDVENLSELYPAVDFSSLVVANSTSPTALFVSSSSLPTSTPKSSSNLRRLDQFLANKNKNRRWRRAELGQTPDPPPCDLRLGLKLRLESRKPFPWMTTTPSQQPQAQRKYAIRLSGLEQDTAIRMFSCCCGGNASVGEHCGGDSMKATDLLVSTSSCQSQSQTQSCSATTCTSLSRLQSAIMYWQYPNFPWVKLFPRLDGLTQRLQQQQQLNIAGSREAGIGTGNSHIPTLQALGSVFVSAVAEQWTQAFEQLFHSWKKGTRQNFYVCASQMTVLFVKVAPRETTTALVDVDDESTCSSWRISPTGETSQVIITPTTLGFREKLRNEGISYRMLNARRSAATAGGRLSRLASSNNALDEVHMPNSVGALARSESQPAKSTTTMASFHLDDKENSDADKFSSLNFDDSIVTSCEQDEDDENESPNKLNVSDDADNVAWLKEIGISPSSTRHLTKHLSMTSMSNRSGASSDSGGGRSYSDGTPLGLAEDSAKSTIVIEEPSSIQALYNVINTSKIFRPVTGSHAGLPPTLLAAEPFLNSALCTLNKSSQVVKKGDSEVIYVCEFDNGPIMPHMIPKLIDFLESIWDCGNAVSVFVGGRSSCQGFNGCDFVDCFVDMNEFVYDCSEHCLLY